MKVNKRKTQKPTSPFHIHSIIGFNLKVPVINLTISEEQPTIAFAAGHTLTILNSENHSSEYLLGHERHIVCSGTARANKFLFTSDESLVNIWERRESEDGNYETYLWKTLKTMIDEPILATGLSFDGEFLVVSGQRYLELWILKKGNEKPDAVYELADDLKIGGKIIFCNNSNQCNSFLLITERSLVFCRWNRQKSVLDVHNPKPFPDVDHIIDSSYCTNFCKGVSITPRSIILWSDTPPNRDFNPNLFENRMEFQLKFKLGFCQLKTVACCNGYVIVGDSEGKLTFYDESIKLCFVYQLFGEMICSMAFISHQNVDSEELFGYKNPSHVGAFFVDCANGRIYKCNADSKPILINESGSEFMTCFDLHPRKGIICGGRQDGLIFTYNYVRCIYDKQLSLPLELSKQLKVKPEYEATSCLSFSSCGRYIAIGMNNGYLAIVKSLTLSMFQKAVQVSESLEAFEEIIFSRNNEFIVYRDSSCTVGLLHFNSSWKLLKKCRVHDSPIIYMSFRETDGDLGLMTISEDYRVADYTIRSVGSCEPTNLSMNNCVMTNRINCPSDLTSCITLKRNILAFPKHSGNDEAFLTSNSMFKFQIRNIESFDLINTFAAPIVGNEPIKMMSHVHRKNENAVAFANKNIIGLQHLPIDGNPRKYLAMVGHPQKILLMKVSHCHKYLFTIGEDDNAIYVWNINISAVIEEHRSSGTSLRPFCNLIPGGVNGHFFTQMQELFFYMQIKEHKKHFGSLTNFQPTDGIPVSNAIDFMRGIGFFPCEEKIAYIMKDIKNYTNDSTTITFENLVKLFVNYRPPFGYFKTEVRQTLEYLGDYYTSRNAETEIARERLVEICTEMGEKMNENEVAEFLNRLDGRDETVEIERNDVSSSLVNIRNVYTATEFMKYILGIE